MRILIIQENGHHNKNRNFRECFCLKRGFEYYESQVDVWGKLHDNYNEIPDWESYDLIFAIENWEWMPNLSNIKTKKFIWAIDAHCKGPNVYTALAEKNKFDKILHATPEFAEDGCWLPNCYDDTLIFPIDIQKKYDIGFCGNTVNRKDFIVFLQQNFNFVFDEFVIGDDMVKSVNSYKIHWNANISIDINYRNFETMGCKTLLLTSFNKHYKKLGMINGENCLMWKNSSELLNIAQYAIENNRWRESIAIAGYELVKNRHTYKHRAKQILEMI